MPETKTILFALAAWLLVLGVVYLVIRPILARGPRGRATDGVLWYVARIYCRLMHKPYYLGLDELRDKQESGPLIVVSNHTCSIDPLLIQSGVRFHIRWMMARSMMIPALDRVWRLQDIIPVNRDGADSGPVREAIRHVKSGQAVGVFPEGRIVLPRGKIWPFLPGVGLLVSRTKAPVLLVWISGTPETNGFGEGMSTPSNARVEYLELIDFKGERSSAVIAETLRQKIAEVSGWQFEDNPPPPVPKLERDPFGI